MIYNKNTAYFRFKGTTFCRNSKGIAEKARKNTRQAYAIAALIPQIELDAKNGILE